jgi:hypothetical protein
MPKQDKCLNERQIIMNIRLNHIVRQTGCSSLFLLTLHLFHQSLRKLLQNHMVSYE